MNQHDTPERLVAVARTCFAEKGFAATGIREIIRAANANLGAVTYHFGSKTALYHAVLDRVLGDLADRIEQAALSARPTPRPAPERLRAILGAFFDFFREHPDAPRLLLHPLARGTHLPPPAVDLFRRNLAAITRVVREGQARGELREVDPILATFTLVSQAVWFAVMNRHLIAVAQLPAAPSELAERVETHIASVVHRAFALDAESP